ncbi:crooked neck-like protein 1 [Tautogolabrus adspersus]
MILGFFQVLWKSYIDFEIEQEEFGNTRNLYKRLLQRTQHVKVWISYAKFELSIEGPDRLQKCRQIFEEANKSMRNCEEKEERLMLLKSWSDFEKEFGSDSTMDRVMKLLPEKVKKRRKLTAEDGQATLCRTAMSHYVADAAIAIPLALRTPNDDGSSSSESDSDDDDGGEKEVKEPESKSGDEDKD